LLLVTFVAAAAAFAIVLSVARESSSVPGSHKPAPKTAQVTPVAAHRPTPKRPAASRAAGVRHKTVATASDGLPRMLGQMVIARFVGSRPSQTLLTRIREGEVGGVILFSDNTAGGLSATRALTAHLQSAARIGGNPPLLIMTDQEGGDVKRLPAPPTSSPAEIGSGASAFQQGVATGRLLHWAGINVDLAPVADVERSPDSFLGSRAFGRRPSVVAERACAFARGLASQRVAYTLKHFPGLGRAEGNTDLQPVSINSPAQAARSDYEAYRRCGANPLALVMISSAIYPRLSGPLPAVMSPAVYDRELPLAVAASAPLTISDDLQAAAIKSLSSPARHAVNAGLDLLMYAQTEQASSDAYSRLLAEVRAGAVDDTRLRAANEKIRALKLLLERQ
jgi:beta-N-acetylhexosaminidase